MRLSLLLLIPSLALAQTGIDKSTHTYKTVDGLALELDAYLPAATLRPPVVMWIHGGALVMDGRNSMDATFVGHLLAQGCAVATIDYRLAPEVKLPAIIEDVRDAYTWPRLKGPEVLGTDGERIAVAGGSAGGAHGDGGLVALDEDDALDGAGFGPVLADDGIKGLPGGDEAA